MRKTIIFTLLNSLLLLQFGCSVRPSEVVIIDGSSHQSKTNTAQPLPINKSLYSKNIFGIRRSCASQTAESTEQPSLWRVKYYSHHSKNFLSVVKGILRNGREYPVILDTGASATIFVNDIHLRENKLAFYPFKKNNGESANWGICDLDELCIGEMSLAGWPCYYQQQHAEVRLFGLPISKDKTIVVGLPILRQFKYIEFDNVNEEVYFSLDSFAEQQKSSSWAQYSFVIEEDMQGNAFLLVNLPITGEETKLQLDTGNSEGLTIGTKLWGRMNKKIQDVTLTEGKALYPYIGKLSCKKGTIEKIDVGNRTVKNLKLSVFPDNSPIIEGSQGLLGMQCFQDTVMVLDFEKNLIWVKSSNGNQLNSAVL